MPSAPGAQGQTQALEGRVVTGNSLVGLALQTIVSPGCARPGCLVSTTVAAISFPCSAALQGGANPDRPTTDVGPRLLVLTAQAEIVLH